MIVQKGDHVTTRDGRFLFVTDAPESDENGMVSTGPYPGTGMMPAETLFLGYVIHPELFDDPNIGEPGYEPKLFVYDFSEVVSVQDQFGDLVERS